MPDIHRRHSNEQMSAFEAEIDRVTSAAEAEVEAARAEAEATRAAAERAERQATLRAAAVADRGRSRHRRGRSRRTVRPEGIDVPDVLGRTAEKRRHPSVGAASAHSRKARARIAGREPRTAEGAEPGGPPGGLPFARRPTPAPLEPKAGDDADAVLFPRGSSLWIGRSRRGPCRNSESLEEGAAAAMMRGWPGESQTAGREALATLGQDIEGHAEDERLLWVIDEDRSDSWRRLPGSRPARGC